MWLEEPEKVEREWKVFLWSIAAIGFIAGVGLVVSIAMLAGWI